MANHRFICAYYEGVVYLNKAWYRSRNLVSNCWKGRRQWYGGWFYQ